MKRQPTEWEKIFANDAANKGLVSKIYKQLMAGLKQQYKITCVQRRVVQGTHHRVFLADHDKVYGFLFE